jgi:hypothetical protein
MVTRKRNDGGIYCHRPKRSERVPDSVDELAANAHQRLCAVIQIHVLCLIGQDTRLLLPFETMRISLLQAVLIHAIGEAS